MRDWLNLQSPGPLSAYGTMDLLMFCGPLDRICPLFLEGTDPYKNIPKNGYGIDMN